VFGNKVLRKIFEPKKDEISEQFRVLYNEEICDSCRSPSTVMTMKSKSS